MIADFFDHFAVSDANFSNVWRINNQFATICQNRLQLVHAFAAGPKLVVHLRRAGEDRVERRFFVSDVQLA